MIRFIAKRLHTINTLLLTIDKKEFSQKGNLKESSFMMYTLNKWYLKRKEDIDIAINTTDDNDPYSQLYALLKLKFETEVFLLVYHRNHKSFVIRFQAEVNRYNFEIGNFVLLIEKIDKHLKSNIKRLRELLEMNILKLL